MKQRLAQLPVALVFVLAAGLLVWWTWLSLATSEGLAAAADQLVAGDLNRAAQALGAPDATGLRELAARRRVMYLAEGAFFALSLLVVGWLYVRAVRNEAQARASQDRFLAAAAHELKTPLATLTLLLDSLRNGRVPQAKLDRYLGNGLREAERLRLGIDNLLTAAGLRTSAPRGQCEAGDLVADLRAALAAFAAHADARTIALHAELPASLPCHRDAVAVQFIVRNLLDNAIKYSPDGGTVVIGARCEAAHAVVFVRDQGRGMDAEELSSAFLPFWRGSDGASGGSGLGLYLAREMLLAQGGRITAESQGRDQGATLTLWLPLAPASPRRSA